MEDKKLTPQESMEIISSMIRQSKHQVVLSDLRISVIWGIITIIAAAIVTVLLLTMDDSPLCYGLFAIPALGVLLNILMLGGKGDFHVRTYADTVRNIIWKTIGCSGLVLVVICFVFNMFGFPQAWLALFYYAFVVVGMGAVATGAVLKEKAYIAGGILSVLAGFCIVCIQLCGFSLQPAWVMPVYMACFFMMFILPVVVIRHNQKCAQR